MRVSETTLAIGLCVAMGCGTPDPIVTVANLRPVLSGDRACQPDQSLRQLRVEGVGDFPASDSLVELIALDAPTTIDAFPTETRAVHFTVSAPGWSAGGAHLLGEADEATNVLLLPAGRPCALSDASVRVTPGTAAAALSDGGLLLAGGTSAGGVASRSLIRVPRDLTRSEVVGEGLVSRRFSASATAVGNRVVIAGGGLGVTGPAQDTFEIYDQTAGTLTGGRLCPTIAPDDCTGRKEHGAARVRDGRVLLVGGIADDGREPLASAVLIDPESGDVDLDVAPLPFSRQNPQVLTLDGGDTYVVGGLGAGGGATGSVYWFDPEEQRFNDVNPDERPLPFVDGRAVAVPGNRIAWVWDENVTILSFRDGPLRPIRIDLDLTGRIGELTDLNAASFDDGSLLVSGVHASGPRAVVIDISTGVVTDVAAERRSGAMVALEGGLILTSDTEGTSAYRGLVRTRFDNPPGTLLATDREWLAVDAAPGWQFDPRGARPDREASISVPKLAFIGVRVEIHAEPGVDVLFENEDGDSTTIELRPGSAGVPLCTVAWNGGPLVVERDETSFRVTNPATDEVQTCSARAIPGSVMLSFRFAANANLRSLRLERIL